MGIAGVWGNFAIWMYKLAVLEERLGFFFFSEDFMYKYYQALNALVKQNIDFPSRRN